MTNREIITAAEDLAAIYCMAAKSIILGGEDTQKNDCAGTFSDNLSKNKRKPEQTFKLPQDADTSVEVTKDDDSTPSKTVKKENKTEIKRRGSYRTKSKAGYTDKVPDYLPVITHKDYLSALTLNKNSSTHLLLLPADTKLEYEDEILYVDGKIVSCDELTKLSTDDGIEKINFPLLSEFFGVILYKFLEDGSKSECKDEEFTVYYSELASQFRKSKAKKRKIDENASDVETADTDWKTGSAAVLNNNMALLGRLTGIINAGTPNQCIFPVLTDYGYDPDSNTIHFKSTYMTKLITEIHKASIKKDKNGKPIIKNGKAQMSPAYSFLVNREIAKERNKKAIEIVLIVTALIERAGDFKPHIKAKNIIERTCLLNHSLAGQNTSNMNLLLKRAFSKAWKLLDTKTALKNVYIDIQFPDLENTPTSSKLDKVFEFPHKGKNS